MNQPTETREAYDAACDNLRNALIECIATFTERWRIPAEVEFNDEYGMTFKLRFQRKGDAYGIFCIRGENEESILSISVRIRMAAVNHLEDLWQACADAEVATIGSIQEAAEKVITFIESKEERPA